MNSIFSNSHTENSASFLTGIKKFTLLNRYNNGLVIDGKSRISVKSSLQGSIILGPTGFSKTTTYVIPNLVNIKNASMYVIDPSQELYNLCHKYLRKHFNVLTINLMDTSKSNKWNPLFTAKTIEDMQMIADALVASSLLDKSSNSAFWNESTKLLLTVLLVSVLNRPDKKNIFYVYSMLNRFNEHDKKALTKEMSENLDEDTWGQYKSIISQPEKLLGSVLATARTVLSPMVTETIKNVSCGDTDIHFKEFRKKPTVLFVCIAEHRVQEYGLYISLLFREILETMMEMPKKKDLVQYLMIDEAGNLFIPKLANYITVLRKRRVSISLILQSMRQIRALYHDDADTIIENTKNHTYFPGLSLETCEQISKKIGQRYEEKESVYFPTNKKKKKNRLPLISVESIRTLKNGRAIFLSGNLPPVMLRLLPWYKNFFMKLKLRKFF